MEEDKSQYRELFLENTKKSNEFTLLDEEAGSIQPDGTVEVFDGISILLFKDINDFADHYFLDKHVPYSVCSYVGDRGEDGEIIWHTVPYLNEEGKWVNKPVTHPLENIDMNREGSKIFTKPESFK